MWLSIHSAILAGVPSQPPDFVSWCPLRRYCSCRSVQVTRVPVARHSDRSAPPPSRATPSSMLGGGRTLGRTTSATEFERQSSPNMKMRPENLSVKLLDFPVTLRSLSLSSLSSSSTRWRTCGVRTRAFKSRGARAFERPRTHVTTGARHALRSRLCDLPGVRRCCVQRTRSLSTLTT